MRLHYTQVRRARGLSMPLPPTPKRPLEPPVLFSWEGVDICVRADVDRTGRTWNEFLDDMADLYVGDVVQLPSHFLDLIERLVPPAEMQAHRDAIGERICERQEANLAQLREVLDGARNPKPGLIARLFRRAA